VHVNAFLATTVVHGAGIVVVALVPIPAEPIWVLHGAVTSAFPVRNIAALGFRLQLDTIVADAVGGILSLDVVPSVGGPADAIGTCLATGAGIETDSLKFHPIWLSVETDAVLGAVFAQVPVRDLFEVTPIVLTRAVRTQVVIKALFIHPAVWIGVELVRDAEAGAVVGDTTRWSWWLGATEACRK